MIEGPEAGGNSDYLTYLVRLWRSTGGGGTPTWRAALEVPVTHEVHVFAHLNDLFAFLAKQVGRGQVDAGTNNNELGKQG